ncbi:MAG: DUF692 domain-containing protein [Pseudomonadota bacterium]
MRKRPVFGTGLGLRRAHLSPLRDQLPAPISFLEVAPENWLSVGGRLRDAFEDVCARTTLVCHGLNLNLGGQDPIDFEFLARIRSFLDKYRVAVYGDHLSFCAHQGQLYELLPLPFTEETVGHVVQRVIQVQDFLQRQITIENASYYLKLPGDLSEAEFLNAILDEADCALLLDINNVYVNSQNHSYDALAFLQTIDPDRIAYAHIAGHTPTDSIIIDTHGAPVAGAVWELLADAYRLMGEFPTLLERDEDIPSLSDLVIELERIASMQQQQRLERTG